MTSCTGPWRGSARMGSSRSCSASHVPARSGTRTNSSAGGSGTASMVSPRITRGSSVLPDSVEEKVTAVASDHQSGATHLASRALRAFDLLVASGELDRAGVTELARRLEDAQPAMASVRHVARLAARVLLENTDQWPGFRDAMQRDFERGGRRAARNFVEILRRA